MKQYSVKSILICCFSLLCLATSTPVWADGALFPPFVSPELSKSSKPITARPRIHISPTNWARHFIDGRGMIVGKDFHPQSASHALDIKNAKMNFHNKMKVLRPRLRFDPAQAFPDAPVSAPSNASNTANPQKDFAPNRFASTSFPSSTASTPFALYDLTAAFRLVYSYYYDYTTYSKGTVLPTTTKQYAVFFDCTQSCWTSTKNVSYSWYGWTTNVTGSSTSIQTAISDLNASNLIKVANQYTGSSASKSAYPLTGTSYVTKGWSSGSVITDSDDLQSALASYVNSANVPSGSIVHLFIPPGVSVCTDSTYSDCYDPNGYGTWDFCAYHSYATNDTNSSIPSTKTIYYTVEPYQWVEGCAQMRFSDVLYYYLAYEGTYSNFTIQSPLDAMTSTLSHELMETITDPLPTGEPPMGWYNPAYGEIGDICAPAYYIDSLGDLSAVNPGIYKTTLNKTSYNIQLEYSNSAGSCVAQ